MQDIVLLYSFVPHITSFNPVAFGFLDLSAHSIVVAVVAGAGMGLMQFIQNRITPPPPGEGTMGEVQKAMQWQGVSVIPIVVAVAFSRVPAALPFYLTIFNLLAIVEHMWIQRRLRHEHDSKSSQQNVGQNGHTGRS